MAMSKQSKITKAIARKVLDTVDAGLVGGVGVPAPGHMCVEAAVCYALGLAHGDDPGCVAPALRALQIRLNDSNWSSPTSRAAGMRRLAVAQLGSAGVLNEKEFTRRVAYTAAKAAYAASAIAAYRVAYRVAAGGARDKSLSEYAEVVVQILIEMKAPGVQWLELAPL